MNWCVSSLLPITCCWVLSAECIIMIRTHDKQARWGIERVIEKSKHRPKDDKGQFTIWDITNTSSKLIIIQVWGTLPNYRQIEAFQLAIRPYRTGVLLCQIICLQYVIDDHLLCHNKYEDHGCSYMETSHCDDLCSHKARTDNPLAIKYQV